MQRADATPILGSIRVRGSLLLNLPMSATRPGESLLTRHFPFHSFLRVELIVPRAPLCVLAHAPRPGRVSEFVHPTNEGDITGIELTWIGAAITAVDRVPIPGKSGIMLWRMPVNHSVPHSLASTHPVRCVRG